MITIVDTMMIEMKALTLYQPWASLIRDGRKPIETRSWPTDYRGILAIHAGKTVVQDACIHFGYDPVTIERGVVLCTANLVDCIQFTQTFVPPDECGDYAPGRFGFILTAVVPLLQPIPAKGGRMLWNWTPTTQATLF
jgi:hypothetical protein